MWTPIAKFLASVTGKVILALALVLIVGIVLYSCSSSRQEAAQAGYEADVSQAMADSARETVNTVVEQADKEATVGEIVEQASKEIRSAPTDEDARAAALSAVCKLPDYRARTECKVLRADPAPVAGAR